ncbi:hypothetical protein Tco_1065116 [Tanacetum coccineum]
MASFDYRLNPLYTIKECSPCGALYTTDYCCSKGSLVDKIVRDPNKTPDSSQRPPQNCARCGHPVDGPYCRGCALLRKKFKEDLFTYCVENGIFQDLQDTSESSDDNTNVVNAPQEPFVVKQDPGKNPSQSPPLIDHHCCYECGDSLDDIFCQRCTCKSCGKGAHYGYNCPPQIPIISNPEPCYNQNLNEILQNLQGLQQQCLFGTCQQCGCNEYDGKEQEKRIAEEQAAKDRYWKIPICYYDDEDYTIAITLILSTKEPINSLSMRDEHLDTIPATELDEVIKSSVKDLVLIPSESEGIPDSVCDVPLCNNPTPLEAFKEHSETIIDSNNDYSLSDDDSYENIDYVDASTPNAEIASLEAVEIVIPEVRGIDDDILLTIKDDILREKLLNVNLLSANIEALKDNPTPSSDVMTKSSSTSLNSFLDKFEGIPDKMCDVPFRDNSPPLNISKDQIEGFSNSNDDSTLIDDDSFSIDDIDYVEASPPDSELVSLEEVKDFHTEDGEIEDDILREKLSKINLLIAKILEAFNSIIISVL